MNYFISPLLTFSHTGDNDAFGDGNVIGRYSAMGVGTLSTSQHFWFCRPFSSHKTLTLLTMGNPPIWTTSWRTGGRVWQSLQKCRLWACLFFWTGGREGLLVVDTIFLFWFWTFLYFKSHNSDSSCWWQRPSVSPPLPWQSSNLAFPSGWWTPYSEFDPFSTYYRNVFQYCLSISRWANQV